MVHHQQEGISWWLHPKSAINNSQSKWQRHTKQQQCWEQLVNSAFDKMLNPQGWSHQVKCMTQLTAWQDHPEKLHDSMQDRMKSPLGLQIRFCQKHEPWLIFESDESGFESDFLNFVPIADLRLPSSPVLRAGQDEPVRSGIRPLFGKSWRNPGEIDDLPSAEPHFAASAHVRCLLPTGWVVDNFFT